MGEFCLPEDSDTGDGFGSIGDGGLYVGAGVTSYSGVSSSSKELGSFGRGITAWPVIRASSENK